MPRAKVISEFFRGDGKSPYDGGGIDQLIGIQIHEEPGTAEASPAMVKATASTVTDLILGYAEHDDGRVWSFGDTGNIYLRTALGVWSLIRQNANGKTVGGIYKDGYVYYFSLTKVGRYDVVADTWNDNWATFGIGTSDIHHAIENNDQIYITDKNTIAVIDEGGTFVANGLDLQAYFNFTSLTNWGDYVVGVNKIGNYKHKCTLVLWDTVSDSYNSSDPIFERGINAIIVDDNEIWVLAGKKGNVYWFSGQNLIRRKKLRGEADTAPNPNAATTKDGVPLWAGSQGIWSLTNYDYDFPKVFHVPYVPSQGIGVTVGALLATGDQLLFSWKNGSTYGVDELSSNRYNGKIITAVLFGQYRRIRMKLKSKPTGTSVTLRVDVNHGGMTAKTGEKWRYNSRRKEYTYEAGFREPSSVKAEFTLVCSGADSPEVEYIIFE